VRASVQVRIQAVAGVQAAVLEVMQTAESARIAGDDCARLKLFESEEADAGGARGARLEAFAQLQQLRQDRCKALLAAQQFPDVRLGLGSGGRLDAGRRCRGLCRSKRYRIVGYG
jgi:hypothetical protein